MELSLDVVKSFFCSLLKVNCSNIQLMLFVFILQAFYDCFHYVFLRKGDSSPRVVFTKVEKVSNTLLGGYTICPTARLLQGLWHVATVTLCGGRS